MREILLGVQPYPQPAAKNPGGDCFACATVAVLRHFFPERPVEFEKAWDYWLAPAHGGGKTLSNTWNQVRQAFYNAYADEYRCEIEVDFLAPQWRPDIWSHAWWKSNDWQAWARRLEAWLSAGWVAVSEIAYGGPGPYTPDGFHNQPDHFVVYDGVRTYWKEDATGTGASLEHEVHVVCSARGAYWISARDLVTKHGAAAVWLIRRDTR